MEALKKNESFAGPEGPVVLVIMDGVGIGKYEDGDMVRAATTPRLDWLKENAAASQLKAHGIAVGLPSDDDMGNSEVGHNAIGCGRVFEQGARLVNQAIESGSLFGGETWKELVANCKQNNSAFHFIGLLSDGNVHSHIEQLKSLLETAVREQVAKIRVHILLDGRDVPPTSALDYVEQLEEFLGGLNAKAGVDCRVASGGGRMKVTMDRYGANWDVVALGWKTHVKGDGRAFVSAREAIETLREEKPNIVDQDLPAFVVADKEGPVGPITQGDSVVFFNFRGDRAIEISRAFEDDDFDNFDRGPRLDIKYAGMMEYDGDLHIPGKYLVAPPAIDRTMSEYLVGSGLRQMAISETQKFGHVTYFFNGNRSGKYDEKLEEYVEIRSDIVPFEERPWMKAAEITDKVIEAITSGEFEFIRLNYPNGDMVGHTGVTEAVEIAVETVDLCLGRVMNAVREARGILVVSADHGNADDMYEHDKKTGEPRRNAKTGKMEAKTSHSLNPVPVFVYDPAGSANVRLSAEQNLGIASLAATCMKLLGYAPPNDYAPSIVDVG